jgi:glycerol kinase
LTYPDNYYKAAIMRILGVDVGTTSMKMGVFDERADSVTLVGQSSQEYSINTYNDGLFSDIEPEKWQRAFVSGCEALGDLLETVDVIALSGTTPGFTAMDAEGGALYPAILMLDQRSRQQARQIIDVVGMSTLLAETANMPVAGEPPLDQRQSPGDLQENRRFWPLQHLYGKMAHGGLCHRSLLGVSDGPVPHG